MTCAGISPSTRYTSVMMSDATEIIGHTYKNFRNVKRFMDGMRDISLQKTKTNMGDGGVTPSKDLVDAKIFE